MLEMNEHIVNNSRDIHLDKCMDSNDKFAMAHGVCLGMDLKLPNLFRASSQGQLTRTSYLHMKVETVNSCGEEVKEPK